MTKTTLNAFDIGCVVVGGIIGVGIFFTPARVAAKVDDAWQVVVAWGIGGVIALLGALVFADLSRRVPGHGGTFLYIEKAHGRLLAFLYGWANWLVIQSGALAVIGVILVDYLDVLLFGRRTLGDVARVVIAAAAILLFTGLNVAGLRVGKNVQNALTLTKTLAVFALVVLALFATGGGESPEVVAPREPRGWAAAIAAAMLPVLFSFGGWQQGSFVAGAAKRPRRDVPVGIIGGVIVVVIAYITVNLAFLGLLGFEGAAESTAIGADAARAALEPFGWGELGSRVIAAMIVVSSLGILNTICLAPPYVLHAMAKRGLFFESAGHLHPRLGTPVLGVLVQGLWGVVLLVGAHALGGNVDFLLNGVVFVDWLFFGLCGVALFRLGRDHPGEGLPFAPVATVVFTLLAVGITVGAIWQYPRPSLYGLGACALGAVVYAGRVSSRSDHRP